MDDQLARVKAGEAEGACMVLSDQNEAAFRGVLERLMDERHRKICNWLAMPIRTRTEQSAQPNN